MVLVPITVPSLSLIRTTTLILVPAGIGKILPWNSPSVFPGGGTKPPPIVDTRGGVVFSVISISTVHGAVPAGIGDRTPMLTRRSVAPPGGGLATLSILTDGDTVWACDG